MRTRVKICGITRPDDALIAVHHGADAIGMMFYPASPRAISIQQAEAIVRVLPPFVTVVGLFVNQSKQEIEQVIRNTRVDLLQFHGDEEPGACGEFGIPYIKAVRMRPGTDLHETSARYPAAAGLLLDAYRKGLPGGTGESFDWQRIPGDLNRPIVLAGGLSPENIEQAIRMVRPYAVDVSSGVEREKGLKDPAKIEAFMGGVRRAQQ